MWVRACHFCARFWFCFSSLVPTPLNPSERSNHYCKALNSRTVTEETSLDCLTWRPGGVIIMIQQDCTVLHVFIPASRDSHFASAWNQGLTKIPLSGTFTDLGTPSTTGTRRINQTAIRHKHKNLRDKQQLGQGVNDKVYLIHKATTSRLGESVVSSDT